MPDPLKKLAEETLKKLFRSVAADCTTCSANGWDAILLAAFAEVMRGDAEKVDRLEKAIDDDPGIYPKEYVGKYEKRTEYMEGWNACVMKWTNIQGEVLNAADDLIEHLRALSPPASPKEENGGKPRPISMCGNAPCTCGTCP